MPSNPARPTRTRSGAPGSWEAVMSYRGGREGVAVCRSATRSLVTGPFSSGGICTFLLLSLKYPLLFAVSWSLCCFDFLSGLSRNSFPKPGELEWVWMVTASLLPGVWSRLRFLAPSTCYLGLDGTEKIGSNKSLPAPNSTGGVRD